MDIEAFHALTAKQHAVVVEASDRDNSYLDRPPSEWKRLNIRRGWTRADKRRHIEFCNQTPIWLRDREPPSYRSPSKRVTTLLRLFDMETSLADAAQKAIVECNQHIELGDVATLILNFVAIHREWLEWMRCEIPSDINDRWAAEHHKLTLVLLSRSLLFHDAKKQEWNRWREMLTTVQRRSVLDRFWLAKQPMSRAEIAPDSGTAFRRMIGEINKVAATAKPPILWSIRSDETTQKWAKHWQGG